MRFRIRLDSYFRFTGAIVVLDGVVIELVEPSSSLVATRVAWSGSPKPGEHSLMVVASLDGERSPVNGYKFDIKASHAFVIPPDKRMDLDVITYLKGTTATPVTNRPDIRFQESVEARAESSSQRGMPSAAMRERDATSLSTL